MPLAIKDAIDVLGFRTTVSTPAMAGETTELAYFAGAVYKLIAFNPDVRYYINSAPVPFDSGATD